MSAKHPPLPHVHPATAGGYGRNTAVRVRQVNEHVQRKWEDAPQAKPCQCSAARVRCRRARRACDARWLNEWTRVLAHVATLFCARITAQIAQSLQQFIKPLWHLLRSRWLALLAVWQVETLKPPTLDPGVCGTAPSFTHLSFRSASQLTHNFIHIFVHQMMLERYHSRHPWCHVAKG